MLELRMNGWSLRCSKCGRLIRARIILITDSAADRLARKFKVCPECMEARRNRDKSNTKLLEDTTHEDS